MFKQVFSAYSDKIILEMLGFSLEKANQEEADERTDYEFLNARIADLVVEMRIRRLKYISLVVDNEQKSSKIKGAK